MANGFPNALLTSYIPESPPFVKSGDLNAMQREHVRSTRAQRGGDFLLQDDFMGDSLNRSIWAGALPGGVTIPANGPNGGFGTALFTATGGNPNPELNTSDFLLGTKNLSVAVICKYSVLNTSGDFIPIFLSDGVQKFTVISTNSGNWIAQHGTLAGPTTSNLGVAPSTTEQLIEVRRQDNVVSFLVNGAELYSAAFTYAFLTSDLRISASRNAADLTLVVDMMKLWVERYPVSSAVGAAQTASHVERHKITWAGEASKTITFNNPFATVGYSVIDGPAITAAGTQVTFTTLTANKLVGSIVVVPSATFTGESWHEFAEG